MHVCVCAYVRVCDGASCLTRSRACPLSDVSVL